MPIKDPIKRAEYNKQWRTDNKEHLYEYEKDRRLNDEDRKTARRQYRLDHIDYFREYDRNRHRLRDGKADYAREKSRTPPEVYMFRAAKHRAKKKGLDFTISVTDIVIPKFCPITGLELKRNEGSTNPIPTSPTLDRIDNTKGYVFGNIAVISNRANKHKSDLSLDEIRNLYYYSINKRNYD